MKKILLTGGNGLIGRQVKIFLEKSGAQVLAPSSQELDLLDPDSTKNYLKVQKPEILIHTAWYTEHGKFWTAPQNKDWLQGSMNLAQDFLDLGGERFFGLGTCAEYDWGPTATQDLLREDQTPLRPATLYGQSKLELFQRLSDLFEQKKRQFLWGRVFFPYGPFEKPTRVIPLMMKALIQEKPVALSSGIQKRDFLYTEDLGEMIGRLAQSQATGDVNLSSGKAISLREIGQKLIQISGKDPALLAFAPIESGASLKEPDLIVGSTIKRKSFLAWESRNTLESGLEKSYQWWMNSQK